MIKLVLNHLIEGVIDTQVVLHESKKYGVFTTWQKRYRNNPDNVYITSTIIKNDKRIQEPR